MRVSLPAVLSLGLILPLWGAGSPLLGQEIPEEVTELRFRGNREFPDEALANAILTRETECRSFILAPFCWLGADFSQDPYYFQPREFRRDQVRLRLFYYQRGYREAVVDTVVDRTSQNEVRITYRIQEGDPVRLVALGFSGVEELSDSSILRDLPLRVGGPLNAIALEASRDSLTSRLQRRGFAHADVLWGYQISRDSPLEARVSFDVLTGPEARFGPIAVIGNSMVSERVVRRMLPLREGRVYNSDQILTGQRNLYNLDIFTRALIEPDLTHVPDSIVPLTVEVAEGDVHRIRAGAGFNQAECVNTEARWASRNFFGGARRLLITGRVSNLLTPFLEDSFCRYAGTGEYGQLNWLLSATFSQPSLLSPRNSLSASIYAERQSLPDIFIRQAIGVNLALTHNFNQVTTVTPSFRPQLSRLDAADVFLCANYLVCTEEDIKILQEASWLAPFGIRLAQDRRNQVLNPTRGHAALLDLEFADRLTGSDFWYTRMIGEGSWYTQGTSRWVFASRLRGGWVRNARTRGGVPGEGKEDIIHPEKRLYAGGANSVRGFGENRLGPKVLYVPDVQRLLLPSDPSRPDEYCTAEEVADLSCDADFLLVDEGAFATRPTGGTLLLEGSVELRIPVSGRSWEAATFLDFGQVWEEDRKVNLSDLEFSPGIGVRYFSPIGPIRVDLAYHFAGAENLQVVTSNVRPFDPSLGDEEDDKLLGPDGKIDWVKAEDLALLSPRVLWPDDLKTWDLRRFQLHLTIGQAF